MKIKLFIISLLLSCYLNIGFAQDEEAQYAKLQHIDYKQFTAKPLKKILDNDTLEGYVSATLFADEFHKEFPYICFQYTKAKYPHEAVLLKVYLEMNAKEIKQIFKERSHLKLKKYNNFKVNRVILFYPEKMKMLTIFSAEIGSRYIDTALWNSIDTNYIRKSLGKSLNFLLQNKLLSDYKAYTFGSGGITLHYGKYLFFKIHLNKAETLRPYLYKDVLDLWTMNDLLDEKIKSIEVDITGEKHKILYFQ